MTKTLDIIYPGCGRDYLYFKLIDHRFYLYLRPYSNILSMYGVK